MRNIFETQEHCIGLINNNTASLEISDLISRGYSTLSLALEECFLCEAFVLFVRSLGLSFRNPKLHFYHGNRRDLFWLNKLLSVFIYLNYLYPTSVA